MAVTSGVPQGSHLGPILFAIYLEDLLRLLSGVECSAYADDLKIYKPMCCDDDSRALQVALDVIREWSNANGMNLNLSKCHVISFTRLRSRINCAYRVGSTVIERVDKVFDLGVLLTERMDMNAHVNFTIAKALSVLGLVKRFSKGFNNQQVSKALYCALVRSRLEYACAVWSPYQSTYLARLESVQKKFAMFALPHRRDPTTHRLPPYNDRLNELGLLPLWCRRLVAQATVIFDLLMGRMQCGNLRRQLIPAHNVEPAQQGGSTYRTTVLTMESTNS